MKKILYTLVCLLITFTIYAQHQNYSVGKVKFGINIGTTFQSTDISTQLFGLGYGATLEYAFIENSHSFFGFSLRGRFLRGRTYGIEYNPHFGTISNHAINGIDNSSVDYTNSVLFLNNRTTFNELSLEAMLKFNRLYYQHGILLYVFAGGGFTDYTSESNQLDENQNMYDYSNIELTNKSDIKKQLKSLRDGSYETTLSNPNASLFAFTPTVGIGFGFRVAPSFTIAFEHKISLPQTDYYDGQVYQPSKDPSFIKDIYHYTSIGFIFNIVRRYKGTTNTNPETYTPPVSTPPTTNPPTNNPPTTTPPPTPVNPPPVTPITDVPTSEPDPTPPVITLLTPQTNSFTGDCKVKIEVKVENVTHENDINFYQNGKKVASYLYYYQKPVLHASLTLQKGTNNFKVSATNKGLSAHKEFQLSCNNEAKFTICHLNADGSTTPIAVTEKEWGTHKKHGDYKGNCKPTPIKMIDICHTDGKTNLKTNISIPETEWAKHQAHGDVLGNCPLVMGNQQIQICHKDPATGEKSNLLINAGDWITHMAHGDTKGLCPREIKYIDICHTDQKTKQKTKITIPQSEWAFHQSHGDVKGDCPKEDPKITICHIPPGNPDNPQTLQISLSAWPAHQAHGDTKGECPKEEPKITICHTPPGNSGNPQTIEIPSSAWPAHQAHGDVRGMCKEDDNLNPNPHNNTFSICHTDPETGIKETIEVTPGEWSSHHAHGDTMGKCEEGKKRTIKTKKPN